MDLLRIQGIQKQARDEGWSYEREMDALCSHGVARIRMKLKSGETEYTDNMGATIIVSPREPVERECTESLDAHAIDAARQLYLSRRIGLEALFDRLAAAGVWYYELDTASKTVSHYDWKEQLQYDGYSAAGPAAKGANPWTEEESPEPSGSVLVRTYSPGGAG